MAGTFTQLHIQIVFAVKYREALLEDSWKKELFKYMSGVIQNKGQKVLQINGVDDHIHILIGMHPTTSLSNLIRDVKRASALWVNDRGLAKKRFAWQEGFGAFSYKKSDVPALIRYIQNQEEHHRKCFFQEEYLKLLNEFEIDYDERFIFKDVIS